LTLEAGVVELQVEHRDLCRRGSRRHGRRRAQQRGSEENCLAHQEDGSTSTGQDCSKTLPSESSTLACRTSDTCGFTKKRNVGFSLIEMSPSKLRISRPPRLSSMLVT